MLEPTASADEEQFKEYAELAQARRVALVVVNMICDLEENMKRLSDEKRKHGGKSKVGDIGALEEMRSKNDVFTREKVFACTKDKYLKIVYLDLDVSEMGIEEARETLLEVLCEVR